MKTGKGSIYAKYMKSLLDFICALIALILFSWLIGLVALLVRINLGSPVLFKQPRPGRNEKIFYLYKFRTMSSELDENGNLLPDEQRLTKFGRRLRGTSLDELPQLWNILKGDMSLVGPRPQLVGDMVFMTPEQRRRHDVKPGLSGLAQVSGRNALKWNCKLEKDIEYVECISLGFDLAIIAKTISQVLFRRKGIQNGTINEIDLTDDLGVFLLKRGDITKSEFDARMQLAQQILAGEKGDTELATAT